MACSFCLLNACEVLHVHFHSFPSLNHQVMHSWTKWLLIFCLLFFFNLSSSSSSSGTASAHSSWDEHGCSGRILAVWNHCDRKCRLWIIPTSVLLGCCWMSYIHTVKLFFCIYIQNLLVYCHIYTSMTVEHCMDVGMWRVGKCNYLSGLTTSGVMNT